MAVLVLAEHNNQNIGSATCNAVGAASKFGTADIDVLVLGYKADKVVKQAAQLCGVRKIIYGQASHLKHLLAEDAAEIMLGLANSYDVLLAVSSAVGKNCIPRAAVKLDAQPLSDVIEILDGDTFKRPIYAGNVIATVKSLDVKKVMTVRATAFDPVCVTGGKAEIIVIDVPAEQGKAKYLSTSVHKSERPSLLTARNVVSGGRGVGSKEGFSAVISLADKLGAAIGATRAAVDAGYAPNDWQVGQTGKIIAPNLYIAAGISGATQHLAGMRNSKVIVAINTDADAPIFKLADYGLVADAVGALSEIKKKL